MNPTATRTSPWAPPGQRPWAEAVVGFGGSAAGIGFHLVAHIGDPEIGGRGHDPPAIGARPAPGPAGGWALARGGQ